MPALVDDTSFFLEPKEAAALSRNIKKYTGMNPMDLRNINIDSSTR
jgi:hypothetical protein